jgi:PelA/Pel-15E family pectate lyase
VIQSGLKRWGAIYKMSFAFLLLRPRRIEQSSHCLLVWILTATAFTVGAYGIVSPASAQRFRRGPVGYLDRSSDWFATDEAKQIADNILTYQADAGGWPKNIDTASKPYTGQRDKLNPTFDNSATTDELRYLAHMVQATHDEKYRTAVLKEIDYILKAQYPNGGWPQFYPPYAETPYQRYITFNDDAMVRLMLFLREVYSDKLFDFVDADRRKAANLAFDKGIDCILKCQIKVDGKLTGWCAQHDEIDFSPRPARTYELVSLSGDESVGIVRLLMSLDQPSPEVVQAIDAAVAWFQCRENHGHTGRAAGRRSSAAGF